MAKPALSGGEKLEKVLAEMINSLGPGRSVSVGFMEGTMAGYSGPRPLYGKEETAARANAQGHQEPAAQVAFWNEFGTERIVPRPFFRRMIYKESPTWGRLLAVLLKRQKYDTFKTLSAAGLVIGQQLQESIIDFKDPRNKPSTIARKGFDDPLIDSHNMLEAVEFMVAGGDRQKVNGGA